MANVWKCALLLLLSCAVAASQVNLETPSLASAQALEKELKSDPDNLGVRKQLVYFYGLGASDIMKPAQAFAALRPHLLWLIEHDPRSEVLRMVAPVVQPKADPDLYAAAREVWLRQAKRYSEDPGVLENAAWFFAQADRPRSEQLLARVLQLKPGETMVAAMLAKLYGTDAIHATTEKDRRSYRARAVAVLEDSIRHADPEDGFDGLTDLAGVAFESGDMVKAESSANQLLAMAESYKDSWNYGNAIHQGNITLGRIRLREGKVQESARYLLLAGATPGSPQLNSYGPDTALARDLLAKGQREAVLQYFAECSKFWELGRDKLVEWMAAIKSDRTPDFSR